MSKKQCLFDWEVSLDGSERTEHFIRAQIISEADAKFAVDKGHSVIEVTYDSSGVISAAKDIGSNSRENLP